MWPGRARSDGRQAGVDGGQDGARAVGGGDPGSDALARIDGLGKGGAEGGGVVRAHQRQPQIVAAFRREGQADEAAAVSGHEINDLGGDLFGGDGEVAFVLAVFVVYHDEDAAGADFFHGFGNGDERHDSLYRASLWPEIAVDYPVGLGLRAWGAPLRERSRCRFLPAYV